MTIGAGYPPLKGGEVKGWVVNYPSSGTPYHLRTQWGEGKLQSTYLVLVITRRALPDVVIALPLNIYNYAIATVASHVGNDML